LAEIIFKLLILILVMQVQCWEDIDINLEFISAWSKLMRQCIKYLGPEQRKN